MNYFDYDSVNPNWAFDIERFLERSQQQERGRLEEELEQIEEQLGKRDELHEETIDELESKLDWYIHRLEKLYKQPGGDGEERDRLKERIDWFYREIRNEKQSHWRDIQELEVERRNLLAEIGGLDDMDSLFDIL